MTTRRSFLKGAAAGAVALVTGVKLGLPRVEQIAEVVEEEPYVPDAIEQIVAEARVPAMRWYGRDRSGGIEINGRRFDGNYSLSFTRNQQEWLLGSYSASVMDKGSMYAELDMQLVLDQGIDQWMGFFAPNQILTVWLSPGYRMEGTVDRVVYREAGDHWLADLQMTCYNVVYEVPDEWE